MNVLFVMVDDLRVQMGYQGPGVAGPGCAIGFGGMSKCGGMHTPNFDSLAKRSLVLEKNYAQLSLCSPSRGSVLTGRRPEATRLFDLHTYFRDSMNKDVTTLPGYFKQKGYITAQMGKIYHPGSASGKGGAVSEDEEGGHSWTVKPFHPKFGLPDKYGASTKSIPAAQLEKEPLPETEFANNAIKWLQTDPEVCGSECGAMRDHSKKFFLAIGFERPHLPFVAPEHFYEMYSEQPTAAHEAAPEGAPGNAWSSSSELFMYEDIKKAHSKGSIKKGEKLPAHLSKALRRGYYASVSYVDFELGRVIDTLDKSIFAHNTLVALHGDHGYHLGEQGLWCKQSNYELAVHAPLLFRVPGVTDSGIVSKAYTEHQDIFPTVIHFATGEEIKQCPLGNEQRNINLCTMGRSLHSLVHSPDAAKEGMGFDAAFSQINRDPNDGSDSQSSHCLTGSCVMGYTVVSTVGGRQLRFVEWLAYDQHSPDWAEHQGIELYDHSNGTETANVAFVPKYAKSVKYMQALLRRGPIKGGGWGPWHTNQPALIKSFNMLASKFEGDAGFFEEL